MDHCNNFIKYFFRSESTGISIDFSQIGLSEEFLSNMNDKIMNAFDEMSALEAGAISNKDENRMVGHYWLRNASMSPTEDIQNQINETYKQIIKLSSDIHFGNISGQDGKFKNALFIGIGGSSLGPQLLNDSIKCDNKIYSYRNFHSRPPPPLTGARLQKQRGGDRYETYLIYLFLYFV